MPQLLLTTLVVSIGLGYLSGGRLKNLAQMRLRGLSLLYCALGFGLAPHLISLSSAASRVFVMMAYALVLAFLVTNILRYHAGVRLGLVTISFGWFLNALAIALNAGLPLSMRAYRATGQTDTPTPGRGGFLKIVLANSHTKLRWLGDVIPVRGLKVVLSPGDILLFLGILIVLLTGMKLSTTDRAEAIRSAAT